MDYTLNISNLGKIDKTVPPLPLPTTKNSSSCRKHDRLENCHGPFTIVHKRCPKDSFLITLYLLRHVINISFKVSH